MIWFLPSCGIMRVWIAMCPILFLTQHLTRMLAHRYMQAFYTDWVHKFWHYTQIGYIFAHFWNFKNVPNLSRMLAHNFQADHLHLHEIIINSFWEISKRYFSLTAWAEVYGCGEKAISVFPWQGVIYLSDQIDVSQSVSRLFHGQKTSQSRDFFA